MKTVKPITCTKRFNLIFFTKKRTVTMVTANHAIKKTTGRTRMYRMLRLFDGEINDIYTVKMADETNAVAIVYV